MLISNLSCTNLGQNKRIHTHRHLCKSPMNKQINLKPKSVGSWTLLWPCVSKYLTVICIQDMENPFSYCFCLFYLFVYLLSVSRWRLTEYLWLKSRGLLWRCAHYTEGHGEPPADRHLHPSHAPGCESWSPTTVAMTLQRDWVPLQ